VGQVFQHGTGSRDGDADQSEGEGEGVMDDDELIGPLEREMRRRDSLPFDGIMGSLPNWVPDNFQRQFHAIRDRLLTKYTHERLLDSLDKGIAEARSIRGMLTNKPYDLSEGVFEFSEVRGICDASFLVRLKLAVNMGPEAGLALLTDAEHAKTTTIGANNRVGQSKKAKLLRGKVGDDGETITEIIGELASARDYRSETAKELWPQLWSALDSRGLDPEETDDKGDWKRSVIKYNFKDGRKTITGGQFANVVSDFRIGKKSG
jgi:hypothetical protein